MAGYPLIERSPRQGTAWLAANRLRLAAAIGLTETILVAADVFRWRWAILVAVVLVAFHLLVGRRAAPAAVREASRIAALSQVLPLLAPLVVLVVGTLVLIALAVLVGIIVAMLLLDRRAAARK